MSDRDRLIELFSPFADGTYNSSGTIIDGTKVDDVVDSLLANGVRIIDTKFISPENRPLITHFAGMPINDVLDLVRAEKEGRLIKVPCKAGDTVWYVLQDENEWYISKEKVVDVSAEGFYYSEFLNGDGARIFELHEEIGKTVFLTKEEAEAKLNEITKE